MIEGRPDSPRRLKSRRKFRGLVDHRAETAEGTRVGVEIRIVQLGGADAAGEFALLMHADRSVHSVVADHDNDRQTILNRKREFLAAHQEIAVAVDGQHEPVWMQSLHRDGRGHAIAHRGRRRRDMGHEFAEPIEAVDPRRIIARAVTQDRVGRHMIAQPDHDLAEVDVAGLRCRGAGPGEKFFMGGSGALAPGRVCRDVQIV